MESHADRWLEEPLHVFEILTEPFDFRKKKRRDAGEGGDNKRTRRGHSFNHQKSTSLQKHFELNALS